jgi:hypothetical protein
MAVFIEKPPVTSSNCYETTYMYKKCFNTDQTKMTHRHTACCNLSIMLFDTSRVLPAVNAITIAIKTHL